MELNILSQKRHLGQLVELNEDYEGVPTPEGFRGIKLYPHQSVVVRALLDMENAKSMRVIADYSKVSSSDAFVESSAIVLSEPFGSGKTIEILALILLKPIPRAVPVHLNAQYWYPGGTNRSYTRMVSHHEIRRKFTGPNALIRPCLIVVGSSVLVQWENAIREFTDLHVLVINGYHQMKVFYKLYTDRQLRTYDIVLLKNGKISGTFVLPGEDPAATGETRGMINTIAAITAGKCWSRVIYDDFDTILIPPKSAMLNALSTIFVSATTKYNMVQSPKVTYNSIEEMIRTQGVMLSQVIDDNALFTNFNIRGSREFVEASTRVPIIEAFRYVCSNPDDNFIRLIGAIGAEDTKNIMEMLNGDAIDTAAAALGIKTNSVADIFQRMLDEKYDGFMRAQYILDTLARTDEIVKSLPAHPDGRKHSTVELSAVRKSIKSKVIPNLTYTSQPLISLLFDMTAKFLQIKERDGRDIERVISNIKDGLCQICILPLEGSHTFIVRCCGFIVCEMCAFEGNQIRSRYDYKERGTTIHGFCGNCKNIVYPQRDLIFVDKSFDMAALIKAKGDEASSETSPRLQAVASPDIRNPKLETLLNIIRGETPDKQEEIVLDIPQLLTGKINVPQPRDIQRKVLVFANYNETLDLIQNCLIEQGIEFLRLCGTARERAETVKQFSRECSVLLVNSQASCAGLNIQFCTDLCFFHRITNQHIEAQVAGRGQRIGRVCNLRVHYILYTNECDRATY